MKAVNLWKTLFCAALAITTFGACSDDDKDDEGGIPSITVNGEASATVAVNLDGGTTDAIEVVSTGNWALTFENESDAAWCHPSRETGGKGKTTLTFTVDPWEGAASNAERQVTAKLLTNGSYAGISIPKTATIKIVQSNSDIPTEDALYSENCGTKVTDQPYVSDYTGWTRGGTLDQKGVTYAGSSASVRNSGKNYDPADDQKSEVSGPPYVFINSTTANFYIKDINIGSNSNFTFTFTALDQESYAGTPVFADVTPSTLKFYVSTDGSTYVPVAFTTKKIGSANSWYLCAAQFKLPASASTDKISVMFDSYPKGTGHDGLRIDDFKLYEGGNGSELGDITYTKTTIDKIKADGNYEIENAVVIATYQRGFLISDGTGIMQVYMYNKDTAPTPTIPAVGDKYTVKGAAEEYGGLWQIGLLNQKLENKSTGTVPAVTYETLNGEQVDALFAAPEIKAVKYTGKLTIDGNYYNVAIDGATAIGSITWPNAGVVNSALNGKFVDIKGWFVGATSNKYFTTLAVEVTENTSVVTGSFSDTPKAFAATNAEAQTLNYTASEAAGEVTFELTGTDADKFTYTKKSNTQVEVNVVGDNASENPYSATLKMKAANGTELDEVTLVQAKPESANATVITTDFRVEATYPGGFPIKNGTPAEAQTFDFGGNNYVLNAPNGHYRYEAQKSLFFGKTTSTFGTTAYLQFPVIAGKKLTKVKLTMGQQGGKDIILDIFDAAGESVSDGSYKTLTGSPSGGTPTEYSHEFIIAGVNDTAYRLASMTNGKNLQIAEIVLTYE